MRHHVRKLQSKRRLGLTLAFTVSLLIPVPAASAGIAAVQDTAAYQHSSNLASDLAYQPPAYSHPEPRLGHRPETVSPQRPSQSNPWPIMFIENAGQFDNEIQFVVRGHQGAVILTPGAIWMTALEPKPPKSKLDDPLDLINYDAARKGVHVKYDFVGANPNPTIVGFDPLDTIVSYFLGNTPDDWRPDVPVWGGVRYEELYPGVDLEITSQNGQWHWRVVADDAANLDAVSLRVDGTDQTDLRGDSLRLSTNVGEFALPLLETVDRGRSPLTLPPSSRPSLNGKVIEQPFKSASGSTSDITSTTMFRRGPMSTNTLPLQSGGSPSLEYSTFFGGSGVVEVAFAIDSDSSGAAYITGDTLSTDFFPPGFPGAFQQNAGSTDAYVIKLNSDGTDLLYATYLGSSNGDTGWGIAVDSFGNAYITGVTSSSDGTNNFPLLNAYDPVYGDGSACPSGCGTDGFVTKLNATGTALHYSTYLGGGIDGIGTPDTAHDFGQDIAVDSAGIAYVTGWTLSADFPKENAYQGSIGGTAGSDAFVTVFSVSGTSLVYSTYYGGSWQDRGTGIAIDSSGNAYISGWTDSLNFPTSGNAYQTSGCGTGQVPDAFAFALNSAGTVRIYATYISGCSDDFGMDIDVDNTGSAYITGLTQSIDFPRTLSAFDISYGGGGFSDAFVTKLKPQGDDLDYSTYLGGSASDRGDGIVVDQHGAAYIVGSTQSSGGILGYPRTDDAFQTSLVGIQDAVLTKINPQGRDLIYSTYFGGGGSDSGYGITLAPDDHAIITGLTLSSDFPIEPDPGAYDTEINGDRDGFASKFHLAETAVEDDTTNSDGDTKTEGEGDDDWTCDCPFSAMAVESQGASGDPINTRTGALDYAIVDLSIPTAAGPLSFTRSYSSRATDLYTTSLGFGWAHNNDMRLILPGSPEGEPGVLLFKGHTANQYTFFDNGDGTYTPAPANLGVLTQDAGPPVTYTLTDQLQGTYVFDENGRIQTFTDSQGFTFTYSYDASDRLFQVTGPSGQRSLTIGYDAQDRISTVTDHASRQVSYGYDAAGDLTSFTNVMGKTWTYTYDAEHRLTDVIDPDLVTVLHTDYDAEGRAYQQFDGEGNRIALITYNPDGTSTLTDAFGNQSTHVYDGRNTLIQVADPFSETTDKTYDLNFRPAEVIDPAGGTTAMTWSGDGANLTQVIDPLSNQTDLSYDSLNNVTSIIDPLLFETKYFYEDANFPTQVTKVEYPISFDGGQTFVTVLYEYYQPGNPEGHPPGLLKLVTDGGGNQTLYTYDSFGQVASITAAFNTPSAATTSYLHNTLGRLTEITDPLGVATRSEYDDAGRLTKTIQNYDPAKAQNEDNIYNITTSYTYDDHGNQIAATNTFGVITRTYYDNADRLVTVVRNLVGQLVTDPTPPSRGTGADDENIRTDTTYDANSNAIATTDPLGVITRTYYDALNRPETVVANLTGQTIETATPPAYNPSFPDQNVRMDMTYNEAGNLIATTDTLGRVTRTYYDTAGRAVTVVQNLVGQLISNPTPPARGSGAGDENIRTDTTYDDNGNAIATTDPLGVITRTYYDALNRPETVVANLTGQLISDPTAPARGSGGPDENVRTDTFYDESSRVVASEDPLGMVTTYEYDERGQLIEVIQNHDELRPQNDEGQFNIVTTYTYDEAGRLLTTTDTLGRVIRNVYDDLGQLEQTIQNELPGQPQNHLDEYNIVTTYNYDALGRQLTATDTLGRDTANAYNDIGQLTQVTQNELGGQPQNHLDEFNIVTAYTYDLAGSQIAVTDTLGRVTRTYYDGLYRPITVVQNLTVPITAPPPARGTGEDAENLRVDTSYNGLGSVVSRTDELDLTTSFAYDGVNRQLSMTDPLSRTTQFTYDLAGNRTLLTDANLIDTRFEYDDLGRLTAVVENYDTGLPADHETNVRTEYSYGVLGNRLTIKDGNDHTTTFTYDALNRLKSEIDPLTNTTSYIYDALGNRITMTDANGATTNYIYDTLNRLTTIDYPAPDADVTFDYDPVGRRTDMADGVGSTTWVYDSLGRPTSVTDPFSDVVGYGYDPLGNRTELTYPDTSAVTYAYDAVNRLETVTDWGTNVTGYIYDLGSRLTTVNLPNGVVSAFNYDNAHQLDTLTHTLDVETLSSFDYGYDLAGNRTDTAESLLSPIGGGSAALPGGAVLVSAGEHADQLPGIALYDVSFSNEVDAAGPSAFSLQTAQPTATPTTNPTPGDDSRITATPSEEPVASHTPPVTATASPTNNTSPTVTATATSTATETPTEEPAATETSSPSDGLVVNSTGDGADSNPGDGRCDDGSGACSLRAAIQEANALPGHDIIAFDIPGEGPHRIQPASALPEITEAVAIDGMSQSGYAGMPLIELNGEGAGEWVSGLTITGGGSTIRALAINGFDRAGVHLLSNGNRLEANFIGVNPGGSRAVGNRMGVLVEGAANNVIGGAASEAANVISGNRVGVYLYGGAASNTVQGNLIGTDARGAEALGNWLGVRVNQSPDNLIGGSDATERNIISGNDAGVFIQGANASGNRVQGNLIGTNVRANAVLGNDEVGVWLLDAPGNVIGGTGPGEGNRIEGSQRGIHIQGDGAVDNLVDGNVVEDSFQLPDSEDLNKAGGAQQNAIPVNNLANSFTYPPPALVSYLQPANQGTVFGDQASSPALQLLIGFFVDSTDDNGDSDPGNGICRAQGGPARCTLRAAIEEANALAGTDFISFDISGAGPHTIQPGSPLPPITEELVIDAATQSGYTYTTPMIVLNGGNAGAGAVGLTISAGNSTVRGLVINGFDGAGIDLNTNASNLLEANFIGTNAAGSMASANTYGVEILGSNSNTVGGTAAGIANMISGNTIDGIFIDGGATGNVIQGNLIGTDINGTADLGNGDEGIDVADATSTTIGGTAAGAGNLISGNNGDGIELHKAGMLAYGTIVQGNFIGLDKNGNVGLGNGGDGMGVGSSANTTIGGTVSEARNLISGNNANGIIVYGFDTSGVEIQGNYIGTNSDGSIGIGNDDDGVVVIGDPSGSIIGVKIGGADPDAGNLISGNGISGIRLLQNNDGVMVQGNLIGTDATAVLQIPNAFHGVAIADSSNNTIGGDQAGEGNTIAFNAGAGVSVGSVFQPTTGNSVVGNIIASNGGVGVTVGAGFAAATGNSISANQIHSNANLGIDLGSTGVTPNDTGDGDTGANNLQNFPVITSASSDGSSTTVGGSLNSAASTTFTLEFFSNPACDPSGNGEGEVFLGSDTEMTDANGDVTFSITLPVGTTLGHLITATATDPNGNTSEFSVCAETVEAFETVGYNWHYTYDPLYRLTYACSDWDETGQLCNGDEFTYTYDAVGNRLTEDVNSVVTTYTYDIANRLIDVGGVTYTYDNNGNLLSDGVSTYTYDTANRLIGVTQGADNYSFAYNGLGDRLQQTVNAVTTNYTLDLNAGLTQVLTDGTNTYLYGLGRIGEQSGANWSYYNSDALGSVRQLTSDTGVVRLAQTYEPFGDVYVSAGNGASSYGFTGEWTDDTGMVHLRARYLDTGIGRFISRDSWNGDPLRPLSLNKWNYVEGNPINLTDPSGRDPAIQFPVWCHEMPNRIEYEDCARNHYGVQRPVPYLFEVVPADQPGCRYAEKPIPYNGYGYLEGRTGYATKSGGGWFLVEGSEIVYDFTSMTKARFNIRGHWLGDLGIGTGINTYAGLVGAWIFPGFDADENVEEEYAGPSISLSSGIAVELGLGFNTEFVAFHNFQLNDRVGGLAWSIGADASFDPILVIDVTGTFTRATPVPGSFERYFEINHLGYYQVKAAELQAAIAFGYDSPWPPVIGIPIQAQLTRTYIIFHQLDYWITVYEGLTNAGKQGY